MPPRKPRSAASRQAAWRAPEVNHAEQAVDEQQRAKGLENLQKMFAGRKPAHVPILKSLETLGIPKRVITVMLGDEPTDCLVIPTQELIAKEYEVLSGFSVNELQPDEQEQ
jgi:hypothetical protein